MSVLSQGELDKTLKFVLEEWGVSMYPDLLLSKKEFLPVKRAAI
jgi:hypothetical protein